MFVDAREIPAQSVLDADVCIVGAGAAGIACAREFIGTPHRVVVLESGGLEFHGDTQALYRGRLTGRPYFPLDASRLRYFGGTTNHWAGNCRALEPIDFEPREWLPHSGWPISHGDVAPYYDRAYAVCQAGPFRHQLDAWRLPNARPLRFLDDEVLTRVTQFSPPTRFGLAYRDELQQAPNVTTYLHANLAGIDVTAAANAVEAVRVRCLPGNEFSVRARAFVLACGALENARLLLASNHVQQAGLGNGTDMVGRCFMEHLTLEAGVFVPADADLSAMDLYEIPDRRLRAGHWETPWRTKAYWALSPAAQRADRVSNTTATVSRVYAPPSYSGPGYQSVRALMGAIRAGSFSGLSRHLRKIAEDWSGVMGTMHWKASGLGGEAPVRLYSLRLQFEQAPNPQSRVRLGAERDALGLPRVELDWRLSDVDRHTAITAARRLALAVGRAGLGRIKLTLDPEDPLGSMPGAWHHVGTTRMGADPKSSVVDANLAVHGIRNLFVAGSSVFPTAGHSVPTATIVALALRLADHLTKTVAGQPVGSGRAQ